MKITVRGIGWMTGGAVGQIRKQWRRAAPAPDEWPLRHLAAAPKNMARFDRTSKIVCGVVGLALDDAGLLGANVAADIGIVAVNRDGCLQADEAYYRDYLDNGRILGRGNLFIYTLPSSPIAEAAIHFGLTGPLLYVCGAPQPAALALNAAGDLLRGAEAAAALAVWAEGASGICWSLTPAAGAEPLGIWSLSDAVSAAQRAADIAGLAAALAAARAGAPA
jgi:3-oxoacyl-[acyl-carrier-protein] synthase II